MKKYICKLYYWEEYETPIGRMLNDDIEAPSGSLGQWRYSYEKKKNYFRERTFKTLKEADDWGQEQMYYDTECDYDIKEKLLGGKDE